MGKGLTVSNNFVPAKWLENGHIQTLWPFIFRKRLIINRRRERFITQDDDFFDVDWYGNGETGIVILIHGLTGSSSSHYILGMQVALEREGYTTAAVNCRACSGESNLKAGSYHAGFTKDIDQLYRAIRCKNLTIPVYTIGFSLGGNIMLKWLAEEASDIQINGSVAVSVPYKLANCADRVDRGFSKLYRHHLISEMKNKFARKYLFFEESNNQSELDKLKALGDISDIKSFWEFDNDVVARLHGFEDVHDYYKKNSSISFLKVIKTNTLLIHALDDPFMTPDVIPKSDELSPTITKEVNSHGGHVGFIAKSTSQQSTYWLEKRIVDFFTKKSSL